jgi:hypothetical protein
MGMRHAQGRALDRVVVSMVSVGVGQITAVLAIVPRAVAQALQRRQQTGHVDLHGVV